MPLAEYLASEQAREDVKALLQSVRWDSAGTAISVNPWPHEIAPRTKLHTDFTVGPWIRCSIWSQDEADNYELECAAYYRPDGDRYVVTDLGEGVRALRLKGVALREIKPRVDAVMMAMWQEQTEFVAHFPAALIEGEIGTVNHPRAESLPNAICRVMLASLRVAQS